MTFSAVLLALLIEQLKPLPHGNPVHDALIGWMRWTARNFDAGRDHHAAVVWGMTLGVPALLTWGVHALLANFTPLLAFGWSVAVLYSTLGFRQFSHYFTDIRDAIERADETQARELLTEWRRLDASELPGPELLRHVIEQSLLAAHRHVFGVFFWFVAFSTFGFGPAGAVIYRLSEFASRYWALRHGSLGEPVNQRLAVLAQRLFSVVDHVPARLTAFGFAVVGNFEEAVNGWRRDAELWRHPNEGIILAAAAGAVGVQLGGRAALALTSDRSLIFDGGSLIGLEGGGTTAGEVPRQAHLHSVVGLVWRSMVLWMLLLALLSLANLIG